MRFWVVHPIADRVQYNLLQICSQNLRHGVSSKNSKRSTGWSSESVHVQTKRITRWSQYSYWEKYGELLLYSGKILFFIIQSPIFLAFSVMVLVIMNSFYGQVLLKEEYWNRAKQICHSVYLRVILNYLEITYWHEITISRLTVNLLNRIGWSCRIRTNVDIETRLRETSQLVER